MKINFLEAQKPLCKSFLNGEEQSYPLTKHFTSHEKSVHDLPAFFSELTSHADKGHCLLKGSLKTPLRNAERRGQTDPVARTEYLVLDFDFEEGFNSIDDVLLSLDIAFKDVSYIFQHSNGAGIKYKHGLRGHVFVMLDAEMSPPAIKQWLIERNLETPSLNAQIQLAKNGHSLVYPLDITVCQNDKLIYIADPQIEVDPLKGKRFEYHQRTKDRLTLKLSFNQAKLKDDTTNKIAELRKAQGLRNRTAKYKAYGNDEILINPDPIAIVETKDEGEFVRVNLAGDNPSWGFYYRKDNPEFLYNFKGHPTVRLRDIDQDFYHQITERGKLHKTKITPLVFRDFETDIYYNGLYSAKTDTLAMAATSNRSKIDDFLMQYGHVIPDFIEDWEYQFDPTTTKVIDFANKWANKFVATDYLKTETTTVTAVPPTIHKILESITADDTTYNHFLNWLADIFQNRAKTTTSWVFSGTQGTGKGVFLHHILRPIFGEAYIQEVTLENIEDLFNTSLDQTLFLWIDEFRLDDSSHSNKIMNKIKNLITEEIMTIRAMRQNPVQKRMFNNVIIATNYPDPVPIDETDRRFNIAPAQEKPILLSLNDIDRIETELADFSAFLHAYQVDKKKTRTVIVNQARESLVAASQTTVDAFFNAIRRGNLNFFLDYIDRSQASPSISYFDYEHALKRWAKCLPNEVSIPRDELRAAYNYLQNAQISASKFSRLANIHRCPMVKCRNQDNSSTKGVKVNFKEYEQEDVDALISGKTNTQPTNIVKINSP